MEEMEDLNEQTNAKQNKLVKYSLAALAILIGIGFVVAIVVVVILHYNAPMTSEGERGIITFDYNFLINIHEKLKKGKQN